MKKLNDFLIAYTPLIYIATILVIVCTLIHVAGISLERQRQAQTPPVLAPFDGVWRDKNPNPFQEPAEIVILDAKGGWVQYEIRQHGKLRVVEMPAETFHIYFTK